MKRFKPQTRFTGKKKNPKISIDVAPDSDRFDNDPDRVHIGIFADNKFKNMVFGLEFFAGEPTK